MAKSPLTDAQAMRLIKLYDEAEREILKEINRLLLKATTPEYSLAWQKTILQRVQQIRAQLLDVSRTWCQEAIPDSYLKGVAWADEDPLAGTKVIAGFGRIHQQAAQVLAENTYSRFVGVDQVVGRRVDDIFRAVALENVKGSVIGYQTTKKAAARIKKELAERGVTGFVDKAGHEWSLSRYAKVAAQEATNQSFRQGTINRFQEKGHDLVRISSHSSSCPKCASFQGKTFSLSGNDEEYPPLDQARAGGLFHVGCLHVLSLAPEEKGRFLQRLQSAETREAEIDRLARAGAN